MPVDQLRSFLTPSQSHSLQRISGSIPNGDTQHPPTAYLSKSKNSGSGIPYKIWRIDPIAAQPGQMRELVRLRRLVAMFKSYRLALTRAPVIKS
jgi:hypothetical protein